MKPYLKIICYLIVVMSVVKTPLCVAAELSFLEMEKLQKASVLAYRVIDKADDYEGAVRVLEEAGILTVLKVRPGNYPVGEYTKLLYVYAKCLFHFESRYEEVEPILKTLLQIMPDNYKVNFLYGDFNYRKYKITNIAAFRKKAAIYYNRYLELLQENKLTTSLPMRTIDALYGDIPGGVCGLVGEKISKNKVSELDAFFNSESNVELFEGVAASGISALESGVAFKSFVLSTGEGLRRSYVDIDNDGLEEVRYYKKLQPSNCQRNLFYKPDPVSGKRSIMDNVFLSKYFKPDLFCGESKLSFLRYDKLNYILEKQMIGADLKKYSLYKLDANASWENLCDFDGRSLKGADFVEIKTVCDADVCKSLVNKADKLIDLQGRVGVEKLLRNKDQLVFDRKKLDPEMGKFIDSQYLYEADVDNDGVNDLISRVWTKSDSGDAQYQYRLFRLASDKFWRPYDLSVVSESEWFFIEAYKNVNYIVTFEMLKTIVAGRQEYMTYNLRVYYMQRDELQALGTISLSRQ